MSNTSFTWIPIYKELAKALLEYKNDRDILVEWIFETYGNPDGKSLVDYLHEENGSPIKDIDPFSFFGIFNRGTSNQNRQIFLNHCKDFFNLKSDIPSDFDGVPNLNAQRSFFFTWYEEESGQIKNLWDLFEKLMRGEDFEKEFNKAISIRGTKYSLTMALFWIQPDKYLNLDKNNRAYLNKFGFDIKEVPDYKSYLKLLDDVKDKMAKKVIPYETFYELSKATWEKPPFNVWLWDVQNLKDWDRFYNDGEIAFNTPSLNDFSTYKSLTAIRDDYMKKEKIVSDSKLPDAYYSLYSKVKVGDFVIVRLGLSIILGWGVVESDYMYDDNRPDFKKYRKVKWKLKDKISYKFKRQSLFFYKIEEDVYEPVFDLLNINFDSPTEQQMNTPSNKLLSLLKQKKQIILQGAPGTGKTYITANLAVELCDNISTQGMSRDQVMNRYKELQKDERIGFTTFHQSMDYEEFVEGIKPTKEDDGTVSYDIKDGIFKRMCQHATYVENEVVSFSTNKNPTIWKVSLAGTGNNPVRTDCMKNDRIRIGWDSYGPNITDETVYNDGGKVVLDAFINKMQIGDYVLSCFSSHTIDAIGVVTGDYEWLNNEKGYRRSRKVKWIVKGINEDIVAINNNSVMTLSSVYRLKISNDDLNTLINKNKANVISTASPKKETRPYVLIIDEINRGNISKILGELITLLEADKRLGKQNEVKVTLPYSESDFGVPDNLYIIGTMNTADRSVGYIDYAIRRRFAFVTLKADRQIIDNYYASNPQLKDIALKAFDAVYKIIQEKTSSDFEADDLMVGHSYFLAQDNAELQNKLEYEVRPLLLEYVRDGLLNIGKKDDEYQTIMQLGK